jgi:hypothetical protein
MLKLNQKGIAHVALFFIVLVVVGAIGFVGWRVYKQDKDKPSTSSSSNQSATTTTKAKEPDSADTLTSPSKVATSDGKQYFYYGAPAGQNNASPKKIIISLPGHDTKAEDDYNTAWLSHITGGSYALASLNWWDGDGEKKTDYYSPSEVLKQTKVFLKQQGYTSGDLIILEGFSRGSANTYAVIANDRIGGDPIFDAAISASGSYQSDFPLFDGQNDSNVSTTLFKGVYWVLVCGGKDDNPNRDGCPAMQNTKTFLEAHGATVLGLLTDPNSGHGVFHKSSLGLPKQALDLISTKVIQ